MQKRRFFKYIKFYWRKKEVMFAMAKDKIKKIVQKRRKEFENLSQFSVRVNQMGLFLAVVKKHGFPQLVIANTPPSENGSIGDACFVFPYILTYNGIEGPAPADIQRGVKIHSFKGKIVGMGTWYNNKIDDVLSSENVEKLKGIKK